MGNCRCDLASHLAHDLLTIHVVMAQMRAMAVMAMRVFNIVITVLIGRTADRLKVSDDQPRHHTEEQHKHKGDQHGGLSGQYQGYDEAL